MVDRSIFPFSVLLIHVLISIAGVQIVIFHCEWNHPAQWDRSLILTGLVFMLFGNAHRGVLQLIENYFRVMHLIANAFGRSR